MVKNDSGALTTSTYDAANQLETSVDADGVTTFTYDLAGNQQIVESPSGITTSTWDDENRRTRVVLPSDVINTLSYGGDGLRFQKQDSAGTLRMVWDGEAYLAETDGSDVVQVEYTQEPEQYGGLVSQYRKTGSLWLPSYYLFDGLGSTVRLTDSTGLVTDLYAYKAFGESLLTAGTTLNPFRWIGYNGYYWNADVGEFWILIRPYEPVTGRWATFDPLGFGARDENWYRYVLNNAINLTDPGGLIQIAFRYTWHCRCSDGRECGSVVTYCANFISYNFTINLAK